MDKAFGNATYRFNDTLARSQAGASREVNMSSVALRAGPTDGPPLGQSNRVFLEFSAADS